MFTATWNSLKNSPAKLGRMMKCRINNRLPPTNANPEAIPSRSTFTEATVRPEVHQFASGYNFQPSSTVTNIPTASPPATISWSVVYKVDDNEPLFYCNSAPKPSSLTGNWMVSDSPPSTSVWTRLISDDEPPPTNNFQPSWTESSFTAVTSPSSTSRSVVCWTVSDSPPSTSVQAEDNTRVSDDEVSCPTFNIYSPTLSPSHTAKLSRTNINSMLVVSSPLTNVPPEAFPFYPDDYSNTVPTTSAVIQPDGQKLQGPCAAI